MKSILRICAVLAAALTSLPAADHPLVPKLTGEWWTIAGNPDLGPLTSEGQEVVD